MVESVKGVNGHDLLAAVDVDGKGVFVGGFGVHYGAVVDQSAVGRDLKASVGGLYGSEDLVQNKVVVFHDLVDVGSEVGVLEASLDSLVESLVPNAVQRSEVHSVVFLGVVDDGDFETELDSGGLEGGQMNLVCVLDSHQVFHLGELLVNESFVHLLGDWGDGNSGRNVLEQKESAFVAVVWNAVDFVS